jgi:hypothetical protein
MPLITAAALLGLMGLGVDGEGAPQLVGTRDGLTDLRELDLAGASPWGLLERRRGLPRRSALERHGGSEASELAVALGLEWLARHQAADGHWSAGHFDALCPPSDRCGAVRGPEGYDLGLTALALLAFLGDGNDGESGRWAPTVRRGLRWILERQDAQGFFFSPSSREALVGGMFGQGLSILALSEAAQGMGDRDLRSALARAVRAAERSWRRAGGWSYSSDGSDRGSEFTLSVWMMLGLKSAQGTGVEFSESVLSRARDFVRESTDPQGRVYYTHLSSPTLGATASGIYARVVLGMREADWIERGWGSLDAPQAPDPDLPPAPKDEPVPPKEWENLYVAFFRTQIAFHLQGRVWREWNGKIRPLLVGEQRTRGHGSGMWRLADYPSAGPVYSTALCVLMLETYYRLAPGLADRARVADLVLGPAEDDLSVEERRRIEMARPLTPLESERRRERDRAAALALLLGDRPEDRYIGARRLADLGAAECALELVEAAKKESGPLRASHLIFLGHLKSEKTLTFLEGELDHPDRVVSQAALSALGEMAGQTFSDRAAGKAWISARPGRSPR